MFGMVAEASVMKLWFFCRAHIMVSHSFDFNEVCHKQHVK